MRSSHMGRSELYIVSDLTNSPALPLVNNAVSWLANECRADPWQLEAFESGARHVQLIGFGAETASSAIWNPLSTEALPLLVPSAGVGLLSHGLRRVIESRLASGVDYPDLLVFASSRSFEGLKAWLHSLAQFKWGWMSIYLLDDGGESDAKALLDSFYSDIHSITGNGRVISAEEFRGLSGDLRSTIDFGWYVESPLVEPTVPPKGSVWIARNGVQIAKAITPESVRFLRIENLFKSSDHYWAHGMAAWGVLSDYR